MYSFTDQPLRYKDMFLFKDVCFLAYIYMYMLFNHILGPVHAVLNSELCFYLER